jgi:hypothetical protein
MSLRVEVDGKRRLPAARERGRKIERCRSFPDTALLVEDRDLGHDLVVQESAIGSR